MRRSVLLAASFAAVVLIGVFFPGNATGRPLYSSEFKAMYPEKRAVVDSMKCSVCHEGQQGANKKKLNEYGTAVGKALGGINVKDREKIQKALKEAEKYLSI